MKKIIGIVIISLFMLGAASVPALQGTGTSTTEPEQSRVFTHAVFAEDGTATWCGYCHYAREALEAIYASGDYPFYYVCLVDDMNTHSSARITEYNVYGFPTVWFDGGHKVSVGAGSEQQAENAYRSLIPQAGARTVADINTSINVNWLGSGNMDITVSVTNNMSATYAGDIRVYVAELESSFGWHDTTGHPYTMPFLDYAQNQAISVASGATWTNTYNWIGSNHNDGYGHNFGSIQYGNIEVVAVVYNNTWHQGYSYPPSQNPFDAYYVDDAIGFQVGIPVNDPPAKPSSPSPADGATGVSITKDLTWTCTDPEQDTLYYDVYFGTSNPPPLVSTDQTSKTYDTGTMLHDTTYYWKINASDGELTNESDVWSFTTSINHAPVAPNTPNPMNGATNVPVNKDISWLCSDPDGDTLHFDVYFGTTNPPPLVSAQQTAKTWDTGTMSFTTAYYWKVIADDGEVTNESPVWSFTTGSEQDIVPPTLTVLKPLPGYLYINDNEGKQRIFFTNTLVIKQLTILVNATDQNGVSKVEIFIDGDLAATLTEQPYSYLWDASGGFFPKSHTLKIVAYDFASNQAKSTIILKKML